MFFYFDSHLGESGSVVHLLSETENEMLNF